MLRTGRKRKKAAPEQGGNGNNNDAVRSVIAGRESVDRMFKQMSQRQMQAHISQLTNSVRQLSADMQTEHEARIAAEKQTEEQRHTDARRFWMNFVWAVATFLVGTVAAVASILSLLQVRPVVNQHGCHNPQPIARETYPCKR